MFNKIKYILLLIICFSQVIEACTNCYIPVAHAGEDVTYYIQSTATLDGTLSYDPDSLDDSDENTLTYLWTSNDESIILDDSTSATPIFFTGTAVGSYSFSLVVNDGEFNSNPTSVTIAVVDENQPPIINVQTSFGVNKNSEFTIDASLTNDSSSLTGLGISFEWVYNESVFTLIENNESSITLLAPDVDANTLENITLNVSDGLVSSEQIIQVEIISNQKPISAPGPNQFVGVGSNFTLDGSSSYDIEGDDLTFIWTIPSEFEVISGNINNDPTIVLKAPVDGVNGDEFAISLVVDDGVAVSEENIGESIFISEYCDHPDGSSGRYIEIYNSTGLTVQLSDYKIVTLKNGGEWIDDFEDELYFTDEGIEPAKTLVIGKDEDFDLINGSEIDFIEWNGSKWGGNDAVGIMYLMNPNCSSIIHTDDQILDEDSEVEALCLSTANCLWFGGDLWDGVDPEDSDNTDGICKSDAYLIDAVGNESNQNFFVAGYVDAAKDAQIIRKNNVLGGNVNSDCAPDDLNNNQVCWSISAGDSPDNSEWIYYEDPDHENADPDIPDVDSWNNAGHHYCETCDNQLIITLTDNSSPIARISSEFECSGILDGEFCNEDDGDDDYNDGLWIPAWNAVEGEHILLDGTLSSDPEGDILSYDWSSNIVVFSDNTSATPEILIPSEVLNAFINDIVLTVSDGVSTASISIGINTISSNIAPYAQLDFVSMSNGEFSYSMNSDLLDLCIFDCLDNQNCEKDCILKNVILIDVDEISSDGKYELLEGYEVVFTSKNSYDETYTGDLFYSWDVNSSLDLNIFNTTEVSFVVPDYLGSNQDFKLSLTTDDGLLSTTIPSENAADNLIFIARMPILSISNNSSSETEGELIRIDGGFSNDPLSSNLNDLDFTITSTPSLDIIGYCSDNQDIDCEDSSCDESAYYCLDKQVNSPLNINCELKSEGGIVLGYMYDDSCQTPGDSCYQCQNIDDKYNCDNMFCAWDSINGVCELSEDIDNGTCIDEDIAETSCCLAGCGHPGDSSNFTYDSCATGCEKDCPIISLINNNKWTKCVENKSVSYTYLEKSIGEDRTYSIDVDATKKIVHNVVDLCSDFVSETELQCCEANEGTWNNSSELCSNGTAFWMNSENTEESLPAITNNFEIEVVANDPVPNAGYRYETLSTTNTNVTLRQVTWYNESDSKSITEGTQIVLDGSRAYDPQSDATSTSYWSDDDKWETLDSEDQLKIISFYDDNGLNPKDGYTYTWVQTFNTAVNSETGCEEQVGLSYTISDFNLIENQVNPSFSAPLLETADLINGVELSFNLIITDGENTSHNSSVSVKIVDNKAPVAVVGDYRIYNDFPQASPVDEDMYFYGYSSEDIEGESDVLRAILGSEYTLIGENSYDDTPYQSLIYTWTAPVGIDLSDLNTQNLTFDIPSDLCSDKMSLTEIDCCENNDGTWSSNQICIDGTATWIEEKELLFNLSVSDGELSSDVDIVLLYSSYSPPEQPSLFATKDHGKINLYWDDVASNSIDDLTKYADFEGYKIYRSTDYGQTWGDAIFSDGVAVSWKPYAQYDLSAEQDSTYCLYKNDFLQCMLDSDENMIHTGASVFRFDDVSGNLDWYEGYYWQDLGDNTGLVQSYIDEDVIDGVDYTYSITAYDRGVAPDTLQYGRFGVVSSELEGTITWDKNIWLNQNPIYTFKQVVEADSFYYYKMNHDILESYIDENNQLFYRLEVPSEWNVGQADEVVSQNEIDNGVQIWDTNVVWPISNPDEFPYMYSLESKIGSNIEEKNFVTVSPGFYASNVSFPDESDLDQFIAADCEAVGDGNKYYEIVNEADLTKGYVKLEIDALSGGDVFENYKTEEACLYAYRVEKIESEFSLDQYLTLEAPDDATELDGYLIKYLRSGANNYIDGLDVISINTIKNLPGFSQDDDYVYLPDYLIECHNLSYLDDPDLTQNWTEFFDGIRMRFDNSLRNEPSVEGAALKEIYSIFNPNHTVPDSTFAEYLTDDQYGGAYGQIILKYATSSFAKKPSYEYELEFYNTSFPDTARFNTTGGNASDFYHLDECGTTFGTLLPFKIKNTTTGKYIKVAHTDLGIWNNEDLYIPPSFETPDDITTHPGYGDCVWSPGEWLTFYYDDVLVGNAEETEETPTFILQFNYLPFAVNFYKPELCPAISEYDQTIIYPSGSCVEYSGNVWFAQNEIKPSDNNGQGFLPSEWYPDANQDIELNVNPWKVVYPWNDGDKLIIKPQKWFVDGDYWIADMSMLGASKTVTSSDLSDISVVPNPYIISSKFNEAVNSNRLRFTHLPQKCTIKIFTISGELVDIINHDDDFDGNEYWDLKNSAGKNVSPGLYIYYVESSNGISKTGKFAIVR